MIYFIKAGQYTKIGYTNGELSTRIASIQTGCPFKLELLFTIDGDVDKERMLHRQFSLYRGVGEWFDIPFDLDEEIVELALQQKPSGFVKGRKVKGNTGFQEKGITIPEIRKNETIDKIKNAVNKLLTEGEFISQQLVADMIDRSRQLVGEHWSIVEDQVNTFNLDKFSTTDKMKIQKMESVASIVDAIRQAMHLEQKLTKSNLAEAARLSRMTVHRLWNEEEIQQAMQEYNSKTKGYDQAVC